MSINLSGASGSVVLRASGGGGGVGPTGPTGPQGEPGATGPQGIQGVAGVAGATGPTGPAGANGAGGAISAVGYAYASGAVYSSSTTPEYLGNGDDSVTMTTGTEVLVTFTSFIGSDNATAWASGEVSVAVSGASTKAGDVTIAHYFNDTSTITASRTYKISGLTPGSNTFRLQYRTSAAGVQRVFAGRSLVVQTLA